MHDNRSFVVDAEITYRPFLTSLLHTNREKKLDFKNSVVLQGVPRQSVTLYTVFSVGYKDIYGFLWYILCSKHHNVLFG